MIKKCKCQHEFQDKTYGVGMRVHTEGSKGAKCTVCGNVGGTVFKVKKKK